jgi:[ribosomal protein S5]-alanine N-acetyltransferase
MGEMRTERLLLRAFRREDHAAVHAYAADPEVVRYQDWGPHTEGETAAFLELAMAAAAADPPTRHVYALEHAGAVIGACELRVADLMHRRGIVGCTLARSAWGRGFGTEAVAAALAYGFEELRLHRVSATCDPANVASKRVLEKTGMRYEGRLSDWMLVRGEWRDRLLYAALRFTVEPAGEIDVPRLLEIRRDAFAAQAPAAYSPAEVATLLDDVDPDELRGMAADRRLFAARPFGGRIAGLAGWAGDRLRHVYVDPAYARQGLATALLRRAEADCRARTGATRMRAGVALHAEGFYRACGYTVDARAVAWDGSGYLEMSRELR